MTAKLTKVSSCGGYWYHTYLIKEVGIANRHVQIISWVYPKFVIVDCAMAIALAEAANKFYPGWAMVRKEVRG